MSLAETLPSPETNMWGRPVNRDYVRCQKQEICEVCGKIRKNEGCLCNTEYADRCAVRRAWIDESSHKAG